MPTFDNDAALQAHGQAIANEMAAALAAWDNGRARTQQSKARILGMSDLGGCREYIRATIAGEPRVIDDRLNLPAIIGTVGGDAIEAAAKTAIPGSTSQATITVTLPSGRTVTGHSDFIRDRKNLVDLKSKDGVLDLQYEARSLENVIQVAGYHVGGVQQGLLDEDSIATLVFWDRAGNDKQFFGWSMTLAQSRAWLELADERLDEVAQALATGETPARWLQDKPESWCFHTKCEFYANCWAGYMPTDRLDPKAEPFVAQYERGRDMKKAGDEMQRKAKATLFPDYDHRVEGEGRTPDAGGKVLSIKWTSKEGRRPGEFIDTIDVRRVTPTKRELPF